MKQPARDDLEALVRQATLAAGELTDENLKALLWKLAGALDEIRLNGPRDPVAEQLSITNSYLALFSEFLQTEKLPKKPAELPRPVLDAAELLSRWLWLQLPEESKKDLAA